jgi:calcineurin-like phosphoesterase
VTRLLFIGDIVGKPGREMVRRGLPALVAHHGIDFTIVNGENSAAGFGITPDIADDLFEYGVHVITGGNHSWDRRRSSRISPSSPACSGPPTSLPARPDTDGWWPKRPMA